MSARRHPVRARMEPVDPLAGARGIRNALLVVAPFYAVAAIVLWWAL